MHNPTTPAVTFATEPRRIDGSVSSTGRTRWSVRLTGAYIDTCYFNTRKAAKAFADKFPGR